jgi:hypothetical protein
MHGPIALIDTAMPVIVIATRDRVFMQETAARFDGRAPPKRPLWRSSVSCLCRT